MEPRKTLLAGGNACLQYMVEGAEAAKLNYGIQTLLCFGPEECRVEHSHPQMCVSASIIHEQHGARPS